MNQSIKARLFAAFSVIILILFVLGLFMVNKLSETNQQLENLVDVSAKKISLSHEILIEVLNAGRHEKNILLSMDVSARNTYRQRLDESLKAVEKKVPELRQLMDEEGARDVAEFTTVWSQYEAILSDIINLSTKGDSERAFDLSTNKALNVREEVTDIIERIVARNEKKMADDKLLSEESYRSSVNLIVALIILGLLFSIAVALWIVRGITNRIYFISKEAERIASREFTGEKLVDSTVDELKPIFDSLVSINHSFSEVAQNASLVASGNFNEEFVPRSSKDVLGNSLKQMTVSLRDTTAENVKHTWLTTGQNMLNENLRGDQSTEVLANNLIGFLAEYVNASIGAAYLLDERENRLALVGRYAFSSDSSKANSYALGEGLVGQAAGEKKPIILNNVAAEDIRIESSIVNARPRYLMVVPFLFEGETIGVVELGKLISFTETEKEFLYAAMDSVGIAVNSAIARRKIQMLLEETQTQSEELQSQQEELKQMNEELEEQTQNLRQQQEELQMTNEELEEQTQALENKNREVEAARNDIEQKSKQLEVSSRYKSEFLANMSHELRTPLNSLLILSKDLSDNKAKNLSEEQVESAEIIHKSGRDLLLLINEVLDLSKIEAGKMSLNVEEVALRKLVDDLQQGFKRQAEEKGLTLSIVIDDNLPEAIHTDAQRLGQVLKNLLSNALKFTQKGGITLKFKKAPGDKMAISVTDTGIGIPADKLMTIFEAFQQADGGTARKYGGTGLGLSISRELAKLMSGEITLQSKENEGSTFTLTIPLNMPKETSYESPAHSPKKQPAQVFRTGKEFLNYPALPDDREEISKDDRVVLVVEDDLKFSAVLLRQAHKKGFKVLSASTGEDGLALAAKFMPHAIILDIELPGVNGLQTLAELKANPSTRHIPVHIMSVEERSLDPIKEGAVEYLTKPLTKEQLDEAFSRMENFIERKMKNLLIVEDDENSRKAIRKLIGNGDVKCIEASSGNEALKAFNEHHIDCVVLDLGLPDMNGFELIQKFEDIKGLNLPPIIIYTGRELTRAENEELHKYAESIIIKGVKSEERLLDETALFLHRTISNLPEPKQQAIVNLYDKEKIFHGKRVLVVDDDMRNVFALSKILKDRGMEVIKADNGLNALEMLDKNPETDMVLMDIMMPEMDGYEAMRRIRQQDKFKALPIIALTAKAMKDDKAKCIEAGANDYTSKPVDVERLLSLMRVWLSR